MNWDTFRFEFDEDGHFVLQGREGWREPICVICGKPIAWVLDMFSFTTGPPYRLGHARCLWQDSAFREQVEEPREVPV
jgi:hypothetical protein